MIPWTGCPCGCMTRLPWVDDPDCARHLPIGPPREWGAYDVVTLGLDHHSAGHTAQCREYGERALQKAT